MFCVWAGLERFVLVAFRESLVLFQNSSSQFDKFVSDSPPSNKQTCVCGGGGGGGIGGGQTKRLYSQSPNSLLCQKQSCSPTPISVPNKTVHLLPSNKQRCTPLLTPHPHLRVKQSHTAPFGIPGKATPLFIPKESSPVPSRWDRLRLNHRSAALWAINCQLRTRTALTKPATTHQPHEKGPQAHHKTRAWTSRRSRRFVAPVHGSRAEMSTRSRAGTWLVNWRPFSRGVCSAKCFNEAWIEWRG